MTYRMTKAMQKDNDRITAWLRGEEFKENARAKPAVPELDRDDVLDMWTPPDVTGAAQFFTPPEAALEVWEHGYPGNLPEGARILDPCAGIGHLFHALQWEWWWDDDAVTVDAYEVEEECINLGRKLWPTVNWFHSIPFDELDAITGAYDLVFMNPPFGTTRGMYGGRDEMCGGAVSRSEHVFLWLAALALKEDGLALVILPYNTWDKVPKKAKPWFEERLVLENTWGPLPGEFRHSKSMRVHSYIFQRTSYDVPVPQSPGEAIPDETDGVTPDTAATALSGDPEQPEPESGSLMNPDTPRSVTYHSDGTVTIAVEEEEDDGAVAVGYMDGEVWLRVFVEDDTPKPGEIGVEPVAIRDATGIVGYVPMVKVRGMVKVLALSDGVYDTASTVNQYMCKTPEEAMVLWHEADPVHRAETVWTAPNLWRAFLRKVQT